MGFAAGLRQSLRVRDFQLAFEFNRGDSLREVLDRHLLAVEGMAEGELLTSILLLSADGKRLTHGAAPNTSSGNIAGRSMAPLEWALKPAHAGRRPISAGPSMSPISPAIRCGRAIGASRCGTDCAHAGRRRSARRDGIVVGTFAIYRRHPSGPTTDELDAIETITSHVAQAILQRLEARTKIEAPVHMKLVAENFNSRCLAPTVC